MDYSNVVEHVPQGCFLCGSHNGPYIDTQIVDKVIATADGDRMIRGRVAVCIGVDERPGCAVLIGRTAGLTDPAYPQRLRAEIAEREQIIAALEVERNELLATQVKVVPVAELEARLAEHI